MVLGDPPRSPSRMAPLQHVVAHLRSAFRRPEERAALEEAAATAAELRARIEALQTELSLLRCAPVELPLPPEEPTGTLMGPTPIAGKELPAVTTTSDLASSRSLHDTWRL